MELFLLLLGLLIFALNFLDFFHTTLSGQGFWKISGKLNELIGRLVLRNRQSLIFNYSGFIHLLTTTFTWLFLMILATFIIYASGETMVVNSETKVPASLLERFYFTGYVISTLGIGDFVPGNNVSRVLTIIFSFSGFILLTTALTYLISVVGAVLQKKQLALHIAILGKDINEIYESATTAEDYNSLLENASSLRERIIQNSSSYVFFPIVQYFLTTTKDASLDLQLVRMHEVLVVLSYQYEDKSAESLKIKSLKASFEKYLKLGLQEEEDFQLDPKHLSAQREFWHTHGIDYKENTEVDKSIDAALKSAGWRWEDVYEVKSLKS